MNTYLVDIDFYSMELKIKAKSKAEARRKAKARIKRGIAAKHINHIYIDEI